MVLLEEFGDVISDLGMIPCNVPFCKFYQNGRFFNSFTMYSNSSPYNSSYMDSIDSKIPPISFKLDEEGPKG